MSFENAEQAVTAAVSAIFERWTALVLTVEHQLAGDPEIIRRMLNTTVKIALSVEPRFTVDDLTDYFYDEFDRMQTDVEDDSPEQVAAHVMHIRDAASRNDFTPAVTVIEKVSAAGHSNAGQSVQGEDAVVHAEMDEGDDSDDMGDDDYNESGTTEKPTNQGPVIDADGFTEVRRNRHHR